MDDKGPARGFIALMAVIVIGLSLLGIAAEEGRAGWYARYNVLSAERKEQAGALAEGCADQALARLLSDPELDYGAPLTSVHETGTCSVTIDTESTPGLVLLKSRGEVSGSVANLELALSLGSVRLGGASTSEGTLIIGMSVEGTDAALSDFSVSIPSASPSAFAGTGRRAVSVTGSYAVSVEGPEGYRAVYSGDCDDGRGSLSPGEAHSCAIAMERVPTTLLLFVQVINDDGGARTPLEFPLSIDGVAVEEGVPVAVAPGDHMVSAPSSDSTYAASAWSGDCSSDGSVNVSPRDERTCTITYDDRPGSAVCLITPYASPTTSTGSNSWLDPLGVLLSGGTVAYTTAAATGDYFGFPLASIPLSDSVRAVRVALDARSSSASCAIGVRLSHDGGVTWTSEKTRTIRNSFETFVFGGASDAWSPHVFTPSEVMDTSRFRVRIRDIDTGTACANDARTDLDSLRVDVSYGASSCVVTDAPPGSTGPGVFVETRVINDDGGTGLPGRFRILVDGAPSPGVGAPGARYDLGAGTYLIEGEEDPRYILTASPSCDSGEAGPLRNGEVRHCVLIYDDVPEGSAAAVTEIVLDSWREIPTR